MALNESPGCRLNNNEFRELIPHLKLEDMLMTQIKKGGTWYPMFNINTVAEYQLKTKPKCQMCQERLTFEGFKAHLKTATHLNALKVMEQFFHPFYTYTKNCEKLARGEAVSKEELEDAILKANAAETKVAESQLLATKRIAQYIEDLAHDDFDKTVIDIVTKTDVQKPEHLVVKVGLPLLELLKLEFSVVEGEWKPLLITDRPHPNSKYFCALCSKFCAGIITVNAHFKGYLHKTKQLESLGVRCSGHEHLTKNCEYSFNENYSFEIKKEVKPSLRTKALVILKKKCEAGLEENNGTNESRTDINPDIALEKSTKDYTVKEIAIPPLSAAIEAKVKVLKQFRQKNSDVEGLIGVEYVVKLMKSENDTTPMYECCLCEIVLNEARMQGHLIGYNHRLKYCDIHYPDTIKKYKNIIGHVKYSDYFNAMGHILSKVAQAIEQHHGRSLPYVISASKFMSKRSEIVALVYSFRNACQQHGPSFSNVISADEIKMIINEKRAYKQPSAPNELQARFTMIPDGKFYLDQRSHDPNKRVELVATRKRARSRSPKLKYDKYKCERSQTRSRSFSPERTVEYKNNQHEHSEFRLRNIKDIWKVYREEMSTAANNIERLYSEYRKNPENHPLYDQEWNKFWRRRKEELLSQGIDHRSYNYQPEWVQFFRQRLEQLFGEELQESKVNIRKRLNIPLDAEEDYKLENHTATAINESLSQNIESRVKRQRYDSRSSSSIDRNTARPVRSWPEHDSQNLNISSWEDDKPNVIHVLRLLTALEDHLGSLGSKIMDLLSKALTLEKTCIDNPAELERKILTFDNCTLLETAVEKLKGLLYAGLLDANKIQGFNRVIQYTTEMLKYANRMGWRTMSNILPEESGSHGELQKLLEAMQSNRPEITISNQKSLSDTLMELISFQKGNVSERNSHKKIDLPYTESTMLGKHEQTLNRAIMPPNINRYSQCEPSKVNEMSSISRVPIQSNFSGNLSARPFVSNMYNNMHIKSNNNGNSRNNFNSNFVNAHGKMNSSDNNSVFGNNFMPRIGPHALYNQVGSNLANMQRNSFMNSAENRDNVSSKGTASNQMWPTVQRH